MCVRALHEAFAPGEHPVIGQQHPAAGPAVRGDGVRHLPGAGRGIGGNRNYAQLNHSLKQDGPIQRNACNGEGCGRRRMGVDTGNQVRILFIDPQMYLQLTGELPGPLEHTAL